MLLSGRVARPKSMLCVVYWCCQEITETVGNELSRTASEKSETQKWRVPDVVVVQGQTGLMEWRSADVRLSGDVELLECGEGFSGASF